MTFQHFPIILRVVWVMAITGFITLPFVSQSKTALCIITFFCLLYFLLYVMLYRSMTFCNIVNYIQNWLDN